MSTRIPSSLAWLIDKRARLVGKIQKASKIIDQAHELAIERIKMRDDLAAIDRALEMHDIQIDAECIPPIAPRKHQRIRLSHGELTRVLLQFLRESGREPLSTDALTMMLIERCVNLQESPPDPLALQITFRRLRLSVRYRLKALASDAVIARAPCASGSRAARWISPTLPPDN
jgi:hypothetical protein